MEKIKYHHTISDKVITDALDFLQTPDFMTKQLEYVTRLKRKSTWLKRKSALGTIGCAILMCIISGIALVILTVILPYVVPKNAPKGPFGFFLLSLIFVFLGSIAHIIRSLRKIAKTRKVEIETPLETNTSLKDICTQFYREAFCKATPTESKEDEENKYQFKFIDVCQFFPVPVLATYVNDWSDLAEKWELCRREVTGQYTLFSVEKLNINIEETARSNPHIVDINICLTGRPLFERYKNHVIFQVTFQNVALRAGKNWFLVSPEPGERVVNED